MSERQDIADWLLSVQGRVARIVTGSLLIILGLGVIGGFIGVLLLLIGAVPIASAAYGALLVGPLFGRDIRGRRPQEQPDEETEGEAKSGDEQPSASDEPRDEGGEDGSRKEPDEEWSAPPPARAERPPGQEPRTRDLRAEDDPAAEPST
jgi:hypothetical protein